MLYYVYILGYNDNDFKIVQTDDGEILLVPCDEEEPEALSLEPHVTENSDPKINPQDDLLNPSREEKIKDLIENQNRDCSICGQKAIHHRVQQSLESPGNDGQNTTIQSTPLFVYKCCMESCRAKGILF